jgi:hypothetical protein
MSQPFDLSARRGLLDSWLAVAALALVLTLYRAWLVGHIGITLFYDEAQYWDWSRQLAWGYYSKPPMIAALIRLTTSIWGDGMLAVKLSSMLLYPLTAVFTGLLTQALNPRAGTTAAALILCLPMTCLLSLFASTDATLLLFWSAAAYTLWQAQTTDRLGWWAALGVACGLGLLSKYTMAAFGLSAALALWLVPGPRKGLMRPGPWLAALVALAWLAPNLAWNAAHDFPTLKHTADITTRAHRAGGVREALEFVVGQSLLLGPIGAWWAWRGLRGVGRPGDVATVPAGARAYLLALTLPLLALAVAQAYKAHAHLNWAAPAHIGSVVLTALALHHRSGAQRRRAVAWVLASNLVLTGIATHAADIAHLAGRPLPSRLDAFVRMRGWDRAFAQVRGQIPVLAESSGATGPRPTVLAVDRVLLAQSTYQWRDLDVHPVAWNPRGGMEDHYELTTHLQPAPGRQWLLLTQTDAASTPIAERFEHAEAVARARVEVAPGRFIELHAYLLSGFKGYAAR